MFYICNKTKQTNRQMINEILKQLKSEPNQSMIISDGLGTNFKVEEFHFEVEDYSIICIAEHYAYVVTSLGTLETSEEKNEVLIKEIIDENGNDIKGEMLVSDFEFIQNMCKSKIEFTV